MDQRRFRLAGENAEGDVDGATEFVYHQHQDRIWGRYSGGKTRAGVLLGTIDEQGTLNFRYSHYDHEGRFRAGECVSTRISEEADLLKFNEIWRWTEGGEGTGKSIIEEVQ